MSDETKFLGKLDDLNDKINNFTKSAAAEREVATKGLEEVKAEVEEQRKQLQELFEHAKRVEARPQTDAEVCRSIAEQVIKAQDSATGAAGGFLVDDTFSNEIKSTQETFGVVPRIWGANIIPMASDVLKVPVATYGETTGNEPEMQGPISQGSAITADDGTVAEIELTAKKYGTLVYVSSELIADSRDTKGLDYVGSYLRTQISRQTAKKKDDLVFNDPTDGLLFSSDIQSVALDAGDTAFSNISIEKMRALQDAVTDEAYEMGAYYHNRTIRTLVANLREDAVSASDSAGAFLLGSAGQMLENTFDGYNLEHVRVMPTASATAVDTAFVLFGDLANAMCIGERQVDQLAVSNDYRFANDQTSVRFLFRFAFKTDANIGRAAAVLKTAAV